MRSLAGLVVVLYLVADLGSVRGPFSALGLLIPLAAVVLALVPALLRDRPGIAAARIGWLSLGYALVLVAAQAPAGASLVLELAPPVGYTLVAVGLTLLAVDEPEPLRALARPGTRLLARCVGVAALAPALVSVVAPDALLKEFGPPPAWIEQMPAWLAHAALLFAATSRLLRRQPHTSPEGATANTWAALGLLGGCLGAFGALLAAHRGDTAAASLARTLGALAVCGGHLAMVRVLRTPTAAANARRIAAGAVATMLAALVAVRARPHVPDDALAFGTAAALLVLTAALFDRIARRVGERVLGPDAGRLLDAIGVARRKLVATTTLEDVARAVLPPLTGCARSPESRAVLWTVDPDREVTTGASGEPVVREARLPAPLREHLESRREALVSRADVETAVTRQPFLQPLCALLDARDVLTVVALRAEEGLEGALAVPRGRRRAPLSLEEREALIDLGRELTARVGLVAALDRARRRAQQSERRQAGLAERLAELEQEQRRMRAEAAMRATEPARAPSTTGALVAYSAAMREARQRAIQLAPLQVPVLLVAEPGCEVESLARVLHEHAGRGGGPFLVADATLRAPDASVAALVGDAREGSLEPGWLRVAHGGTLFVRDLPALSLEAQAVLAEALATHEVRPVGSAASYPVDVRLVAWSRVAPAELLAAGTLDPNLARWLESPRIDVPPLRERTEDLPSLVLLAVHRACRALGRTPVGVEPAAMDALLRHDWPGNLEELDAVVARAVARCQGPLLGRSDLPPLTGDRDPLDAPWSDIERRALQRALALAGGDVGSAARALGIAPTTLRARLRRLGLTSPTRRSSRPPPSDPVSGGPLQ
ncbi:MAG: sigma 54-interacting transcriptional regulator [Myxococcota bacterium]|nr:sigma 54-interacting transcriptional regulator [Myxococcota bacterium]MDW8361700.1 sigma 54-interacting transcriptional regulator [Myxococcales bacterium]